MRRNLLKEHSTLLEAALQFADPFFVAAVGVLAYYLKFDSWDLEARYVTALLAVLVVAFAVFSTLKLHQSQRGISFAEEVRGLLVAWLAIAVIGIVFLFLTKTGSQFSREWALVWLASGFVAHVASRAAIRVALRALRRRGRNLRHIVIVGAGAHGREIARRLRATPWSGFNVRGFYDDDPNLAGNDIDGVPVLGNIDRFAENLEQEDPADQVWIALPLRAENRIREVLIAMRQTTIGRALRPGHLQLSPAASFGIRGRRIAGAHPHRFAAHGRRLDVEGARGFRAGIDSSSRSTFRSGS